MNHFQRSILGAAIAAVLTPAIVQAQSADATLRGKAPADTDVTAKNVATGFTRRAHTGADGSYTIAGLPPGTYRVEAGGIQQVVTLSVATVATLNLGGEQVAEVAPPADEVTQEVVVTGRRLTEVKTSEVANVVSTHQIETVPQMTRNFLEFADTVPGVSFQVDSKGRTLINSGAQNRNGINVYIDGVGQKGYVKSGLSGQTGDTQGNPFPQLAIGEYKVITSNYKAEYDQISSAAITAITRSGTNEFEGEAFGTYTADNWRRSTPAEACPASKTRSETKEYGVAFGGPIMQDRMHFFLTYEAKRYSTPVTVAGRTTPPRRSWRNAADAARSSARDHRASTRTCIFGKLDLEPDGRDRLSRRRSRERPARATRPASASRVGRRQHRQQRQALRAVVEAHGRALVNEVQLTYEDSFYRVAHHRTRNGAVYTFIDGADHNILAYDGADPRAGQNKGQKGWAIGRHHHVHRHRLVRRRSHHQARREVQGRRPDAHGFGAGAPVVLLRRDAGGRRDRSRGKPLSRCRWRATHQRHLHDKQFGVSRRTTGRSTTTSR
jgi:hypothetical protein